MKIYINISQTRELRKQFDLEYSAIEKAWSGQACIHRGTRAPIITNVKPKEMQLFEFGFTPNGVKEKMQILNARMEGKHNVDNRLDYNGAKGIIQAPIFRKAIRRQRCLVLANGMIIEGANAVLKKETKATYFLYKRNQKRAFAMAGLWDQWVDPMSGECIGNFAIITAPPNRMMLKMGVKRSPVILREMDEGRWLRNDLALSDYTCLLHSFDEEYFNAYPIDPGIKNTSKDASNFSLAKLQPIGSALKANTKTVFTQSLKLQGMGNTAARRRREKEKMRDETGKVRRTFGTEYSKPSTQDP